MLVGPAAGAATPAGAVPRTPAAGAVAPTAYVTNSQTNTVSVVTKGASVGTILHVGNGPVGIAVAPDQKTAYVADYGFSNAVARTVTPINLVTGKALAPIQHVGTGPMAIAITPNGRWAYVTLEGTGRAPGHQVVRINLVTHAVSPPVAVGVNPESIAITPDGTMAYVANLSSHSVTPINLTTTPPTPGKPIVLPKTTAPRAIAITPDGTRAYVLDAETPAIFPINLKTGAVLSKKVLVCKKAGDPGCTPTAIAISADGKDAYVAAAGSADALEVSLPGLTSLKVLPTGGYPDAVAVSGTWLFVTNGASNDLSVFHNARALKPVPTGPYPFGVALTSTVAAGLSPATAVRAPAHTESPNPAQPFYGVSP